MFRYHIVDILEGYKHRLALAYSNYDSYDGTFSP